MEQQGRAGTRVTVANSGQTFSCAPDELVLDAGLAAGIGLPHNCRGRRLRHLQVADPGRRC